MDAQTMFLKRCPGSWVCQQVPAVPKAQQQTLQDDGTSLAWMQLPPWSASPRDLPGAVRLCLPGGCQDGSRPCHISVADLMSQPMDPQGEGAQDAWQAGAAHSSAPTVVQQPEAQHCHKTQQFQEETRRQQALPPRAASAKDPTEIRLELHQVSALSPQPQARRSFTLPDSLLRMGTLNTKNNQRTGTAATMISLCGASVYCPLSFPLLAAFHTWLILRGRSLPTGDFTHALRGCSWESSLIPKLLLEYIASPR